MSAISLIFSVRIIFLKRPACCMIFKMALPPLSIEPRFWPREKWNNPLHALLLTPFFARSLTLVPRSLLLNRTETLATQAIFRCERAIGALEKMMNSSQGITNRLSEKRKNCYLPSLDLVPGGKRQAKEMCKLLTGNGERDVTQKASIPVIDSNNVTSTEKHFTLNWERDFT